MNDAQEPQDGRGEQLRALFAAALQDEPPSRVSAASVIEEAKATLEEQSFAERQQRQLRQARWRGGLIAAAVAALGLLAVPLILRGSGSSTASSASSSSSSSTVLVATPGVAGSGDTGVGGTAAAGNASRAEAAAGTPGAASSAAASSASDTGQAAGGARPSDAFSATSGLKAPTADGTTGQKNPDGVASGAEPVPTLAATKPNTESVEPGSQSGSPGSTSSSDSAESSRCPTLPPRVIIAVSGALPAGTSRAGSPVHQCQPGTIGAVFFDSSSAGGAQVTVEVTREQVGACTTASGTDRGCFAQPGQAGVYRSPCAIRCVAVTVYGRGYAVLVVGNPGLSRNAPAVTALIGVARATVAALT